MDGAGVIYPEAWSSRSKLTPILTGPVGPLVGLGYPSIFW